MEQRVVKLAYDTLIACKTSQMSEAQCDLCLRYLLVHDGELYDEYYALMAPSRPFNVTPMVELPLPQLEPEGTLECPDHPLQEPTPQSKWSDVNAEIDAWTCDMFTD
tara:strand:+ start:1376 stop:1696 length:321 start_codon:yes stop_codon:yes gene_type:complete